jgi:hypothetical protein
MFDAFMPLHWFCLNVCCSFKKKFKSSKSEKPPQALLLSISFPSFQPNTAPTRFFFPLSFFPSRSPLSFRPTQAPPAHSTSPLSLTDKRAPPTGASPTSDRLLSSPWPSRSSPATPASSPRSCPFPSPPIATLHAPAPPPRLFLSRTASPPPPSTNGAPPPEHTPPPRSPPPLPPPPYKSWPQVLLSKPHLLAPSLCLRSIAARRIPADTDLLLRRVSRHPKSLGKFVSPYASFSSCFHRNPRPGARVRASPVSCVAQRRRRPPSPPSPAACSHPHRTIRQTYVMHSVFLRKNRCDRIESGGNPTSTRGGSHCPYSDLGWSGRWRSRSAAAAHRWREYTPSTAQRARGNAREMEIRCGCGWRT